MPHDDPDRAALLQNVNAEASQPWHAQRDVGIAGAIVFFALMRRQNFIEIIGGAIRRQLLLAEETNLAVDTTGRRATDTEMNVGGPVLNGVGQDFFKS